MSYKYRDFSRKLKEAFDRAEHGETVKISRGNIVFTLTNSGVFKTTPVTKPLVAHETVVRPLEPVQPKYIENDTPPRYPSSTVATGMTAKQKKIAAIKQLQIDRANRRMQHLNDSGITYDPIPE